MAEIPVRIVNIGAAAGFTNGIVSGNIKGDIGASVTITADVCHGIELGIGAEAQAKADANATLAFIGARAQGQASASAGAKVKARLEPNLFDKMGLTLEAGAYAYAAAAGNLGVYLDPSFFSQFIEAELDDFSGDLFIIFLDEIEAEVGVWGKVAVSAMAEGHVNLILDMQNLSSGFEINAGGNVGLKAGGGCDFYAEVGFKNLRRAVRRATLRTNKELLGMINRSDLPQKEILSMAFDFSFPLLALIAFDIGRKSYEKKALTTPQDIAQIVMENFVQNLQRFALDRLTEAAIGWLEQEFASLYVRATRSEWSDTQSENLQLQLENLIATLRKGEYKTEDIVQIISTTLEIVDVLDGSALDRFKRPVSIFWVGSMLSLVVKDMLATFYAEVGVSSSLVGQAGFAAANNLLPTAPQFIKDAIAEELGDTIIEVDVAICVDYLITVGCTEVLDRYAPQFKALRDQLAGHFPVSEGEFAEDLLRLLAGQGDMSDLNSYSAFRAFFKDQVLEGFIINELLPQIKQSAGSEQLTEYLEEVVEPSVWLMNDFVFSKLDQVMLDNLHGMSEDELAQFMDSLATGSGVVVYQILVRNILYFDHVFTNFVLDNGYQGFRNMRMQLEQPSHPLFVTCRTLFESHLPGQPNLATHTEALQTLLYDMMAAFEHVFGPTIHTPERRRRMMQLKRDILLSIGGRWDRADTMMPEAAIAEFVDCLHIPAPDKLQAFGELLAEIGYESALVFIQRMALPFGDFYLSLTMEAFREMRQDLNVFIGELSDAAQQALENLDALTDALQQNILDALAAVEVLLAELETMIQAQLDDFTPLAKTAIRLAAEQAAVTDAVNGGATESQARADFYTNAWPVAEPLVDTALAAAQPIVDTFFDVVQTALDNGEDGVQSLFAWIESTEDALILALTTMVILPAEEAASAATDAVFSELFLNAVDDYLTAREEQKELEVQQHQTQADLVLAEEEERLAREALRENAHQTDLRVEIMNPLPDLEYIYPASVEITIAVYGATASIMSNPRSARIQLMLNGRALPYQPADWKYNSDSHRYELNRVFEPGGLADGMNMLEVSWIKGPDESETSRVAAGFMVDASRYHPREDFEISIDADPPGRDVDHEYVQVGWNGDAPLDLNGWVIRDLVGHTYQFSDIVLRPGDNFKLFTGGSPDDDQKELDRENKILYMGRGRAVWNNEGDTLMLSDPQKHMVVTHTY